MFFPNTYQLYWNTSPEKFFKRMYANYEKFWTPNASKKLLLLTSPLSRYLF